MRSLPALAIALAIALLPLVASAQGPASATIETFGLQISGRTVDVLFRVTDRTSGRDLQGLQTADFTLLEDGAPVASPIEIREERSDPAQSRVVDLGPSAVTGSTAVSLGVVGATIGVVYDASLLTNAPGDPVNYVERGRLLIEAILEAGRPVAPANPESIGLFFPLSVPAVAGEQIRPAALPGFVQDRNAVINTLRQQAPRSGKTNVFDTLSVAVRATAEEAARRGTDSYVVLITDGGDSASLGSYDAVVADAAARGVRLLILGVGPDARLAGNAPALVTLAEKTGGAYASNPDPGAAQGLYRERVQVTGQSAYIVRYTTSLLDDGKPHQLVIQVRGPAEGQSAPIPVALGVAPQLGDGTLALGPAVQGYALRAIPIAIIASLVLSFLLVFVRRLAGDRSRSISGGITRR